jgi:hypothetical protein
MAYTPYYSGGWQSGQEGNTPITPSALNNMETGIGNADDNLTLFCARSQMSFANVLAKVTSAPNGSVVAFSGDVACGSSLIGYTGICFGMMKNSSPTRLDYFVVQPTAGRISLGYINPSTQEVTIYKTFS